MLLMILPDLGLSALTLQALAGAALVMAVYSLSCCLMNRTSRPYLLAIATANSLYCLTTLAIMILQRARLSPLGFGYFVVEILVVSQLIRLEFHLATEACPEGKGSSGLPRKSRDGPQS